VEVTLEEDQDPEKDANEKVDNDPNIFMHEVVIVRDEDID